MQPNEIEFVIRHMPVATLTRLESLAAAHDQTVEEFLVEQAKRVTEGRASLGQMVKKSWVDSVDMDSARERASGNPRLQHLLERGEETLHLVDVLGYEEGPDREFSFERAKGGLREIDFS